jgi:hypothetical protein
MSILSIDARTTDRTAAVAAAGFGSAAPQPRSDGANRPDDVRPGGLGYGLDEAAEQAAKRIRFKPAQADGRAVDYRATVHITFRIS